MPLTARLTPRLLAVALAAALFGLAFPPLRLHALAWGAVAPLLLALRVGGTASALLLAWLWGVGMAYSVGDWMPRAIVTYHEQPLWVGWAFFLGVATTMNAPYQMGFALAYRALARASEDGRLARWAMPLATAAAWCTAEILRGRLFTGSPFFIGNPWALLGYSQVGWDPVMQVASLTGIYGVSFAVAAANAALVEAALALRARVGARGTLLAGVAPAAAVVLFGLWALPPVGGEAGAAPARRIAVVQGDVRLGSRWRSEYHGEGLRIYLDLTREAIGAVDPEVVFWPESALTFFLKEEVPYRLAIARTLAPRDTELVTGGPRADPSGPQPLFYNAIYRLSPSGEILGYYEKEYLLPFAEYFPLRSVDLLRRRFEGVRVFEKGTATSPLETRVGPAAVVVCNEAMLPEVVGRRVAAGAGYILNPSNDTWIPEARFAEQQLDIVTVRAIEQRRPMVRASTSGPSALIDRFGRVRARTELGERTFLTGELRLESTPTPYARVGDLFGLLCALATAGALLALRRRRL